MNAEVHRNRRAIRHAVAEIYVIGSLENAIQAWLLADSLSRIPCQSMKVLMEKIGPATAITPSKIDRLSSSIVIIVHEQQSICVYYSAGDYSCRNRANFVQEVLKLHVLESPCTKA